MDKNILDDIKKLKIYSTPIAIKKEFLEKYIFNNKNIKSIDENLEEQEKPNR